MTVIIDDTTEYESQDNGLAEMAVRDIKGVARSVRVAGSCRRKTSVRSTRCCPGSSPTLPDRSHTGRLEPMD